MIYHVSKSGNNNGDGSELHPFATINHAAQLALPGDTVCVHDGIYREWVNPLNGGLSDHCRIIYEAAPGEHPVIKGSEVITDWEKVEGTVWKKVLPNSFFGDFNPYAAKVEGDWLIEPKEYDVHLGAVYINGVSMYEATSMDDLYEAKIRYFGAKNIWWDFEEPVQFPERTIYRWYGVVEDDTTTIYGNFQDKDPNKEFIEINVRPCCFYPTLTGLNYITVRGFEIAQAACPWTPPTSDQIGMIGPHWSMGWIIENNHIHDAKCSAVSLGKEISTGHNMHTRYGRKSGHRYQLEAVFRAVKTGWSKDSIGSHIVRNNVIHDCGQNAVVGHLGCAFSKIEHNHIYNIGLRREYFGHEMAAIKFHAGIDVVIENNCIHNSITAVWLDWQAQGARVTRNVCYENDRDVLIEVSHGPTTLDNNIFLSIIGFDNVAQGTALVHNIFAGFMNNFPVPNRQTPYHFPHSTDILGCVEVYGGDDRVYNNIFPGTFEHEKVKQFSEHFDKFSDPEDYPRLLKENYDAGLEGYRNAAQPVWMYGNAYSGNARPSKHDKDYIVNDKLGAAVTESDGVFTLELDIPEEITKARLEPVTTARLGVTRISEQAFDAPDGSELDLEKDISGNIRGESVIPGPIATLKPGKQKIIVWKE